MRNPRDPDEERALQARIDDLLCGDLAPEDIGPDETEEVRETARWVQETSRLLREQAPDEELPRRIAAQLPIGRPSRLRHDPLRERVRSRLLFAAAAVFLLAVGLWFGASYLAPGGGSSAYPEPGGELRHLDSSKGIFGAAPASIGTVEYSRTGGESHGKPSPIRSGQQIVTAAGESATVMLAPWWIHGHELGATRLDVDSLSKVIVVVYRLEDPTAYFPRRDLLLRDLYTSRGIEGTLADAPILEIQALDGTMAVTHNGSEVEMAEPDMVLLTYGHPAVKVDDSQAATEVPDHPARRASRSKPANRVSPTQEVDPGTATLSGFITDEHGEPLPIFELTLWRRAPETENRRRLVTVDFLHFGPGSQGRYRYEGLEPGTYWVGVSSPGHVTEISSEIVLEAGAEQNSGFRLHRGMRFHGRLVTSDGRSIDGAFIKSKAWHKDPRWRQGDTFGTTTSDAQGRFSIDNRPSGCQGISIEAKGYANYSLPFLFVGADPSDLGTIEMVEESVVHGRAVGLDGAPLAGHPILIRQEGRDAFFRKRTSTDARGYYRFDGLAAGDYLICLRESDNIGRRTRSVSLEKGQITKVDLGGEGVILEGEITDSAGQPLAGYHLNFYERNGGDRRSRRAPSYRCTADSEGCFRCELLPGETFDIHVRPPDQKCSAPAMSIRVRSDENPRLVCRLPEGELRGRLRDDEGATLTDIRSMLALTSRERAELTWRVSVEDGEFTFRHVPPGRYRLSGRAYGHVLRTQDITLGEGENCPVEITCSPEARVIALVLDKNGDPVRMLRILSRDSEGDPHLWYNSIPSGEGYELHGLSPGPVELEFDAPGFAARTVTLTLQSTEENRFELHLDLEKP